MKCIAVYILVNILAFAKGGERIAGGDVVDIGEYPFAVSLMRSAGAGEGGLHACGGTIVTSAAVLSAASCFFTGGTEDDPGLWRARVGSSSSTSGGTVHFVRSITPHPGFQVDTRVDDLAVLRVTVPMTFREGVAAAPLAGATYSLNTNQQVWGLGWGATTVGGTTSSELRAVQFWVVDQGACANRYSRLEFAVTGSMVCAGWLDVGIRGQCQGDSGSPLLDNGVVVGVHSWSEGCADPDYPGVNTLVAPYVSWIVDSAVS